MFDRDRDQENGRLSAVFYLLILNFINSADFYVSILFFARYSQFQSFDHQLKDQESDQHGKSYTKK